MKKKSPDYVFRIIPQRRSSYITRNSDEISLFKAKHTFYYYWIFPKPTIEAINLDQDLRNRKSYNLFHFSILKFNRPPLNSFCNCQNNMGIKLVTRLHLGLSHLWEHKFKHSFQDTLNLPCNQRFESRGMSVDLIRYVKTIIVFFYKFYNFFCRQYSLMNGPCYKTTFTCTYFFT